jgi:hypothetical protein
LDRANQPSATSPARHLRNARVSGVTSGAESCCCCCCCCCRGEEEEEDEEEVEVGEEAVGEEAEEDEEAGAAGAADAVTTAAGTPLFMAAMAWAVATPPSGSPAVAAARNVCTASPPPPALLLLELELPPPSASWGSADTPPLERDCPTTTLLLAAAMAACTSSGRADGSRSIMAMALALWKAVTTSVASRPWKASIQCSPAGCCSRHAVRSTQRSFRRTIFRSAPRRRLPTDAGDAGPACFGAVGTSSQDASEVHCQSHWSGSRSQISEDEEEEEEEVEEEGEEEEVEVEVDSEEDATLLDEGRHILLQSCRLCDDVDARAGFRCGAYEETNASAPNRRNERT